MTRLPHDHPAIHAIRTEISRLDRMAVAEADAYMREWHRGMAQGLRNALATIDPLTDPGMERDDHGVGIRLMVPAE